MWNHLREAGILPDDSTVTCYGYLMMGLLEGLGVFDRDLTNQNSVV